MRARWIYAKGMSATYMYPIAYAAFQIKFASSTIALLISMVLILLKNYVEYIKIYYLSIDIFKYILLRYVF
jgi:hypothetical protein